MTSLQCFLVGGGIAGLPSAVYLIPDGQVQGRNIHILEASQPGGSLDAAGSPEAGLLDARQPDVRAGLCADLRAARRDPVARRPGKSITKDTFEFAVDAVVRQGPAGRSGKVVDPSAWGFRNRDRADLVELMVQAEALWTQSASTRASSRRSSIELLADVVQHVRLRDLAQRRRVRRYLLRFLRLFPDLETMQIIQSTRYNGYDSIIRPLVRWLEEQGVHFETGVQVTDLHFEASDGGAKAVRRISCLRDGEPTEIEVGQGDLVIVTLGSTTADSSLGSMNSAPALKTARPAARGRCGSGSPRRTPPSVARGLLRAHRPDQVGHLHGDRHGPALLRLMEDFSGSPAGRGGLVTLKGSSWMLTFHLYPSPAYAAQPGTGVWWGYGLFPDRVGDLVPKRMTDCSGREILVELYSHLGFEAHIPALLATANCIPCMLPYTTSQFMPRARATGPT